MKYFVLYDIDDNLVSYYDNLLEFTSKFNYPIKEINRKYKNSLFNYIFLDIDNLRYKLYAFN